MMMLSLTRHGSKGRPDACACGLKHRMMSDDNDYGGGADPALVATQKIMAHQEQFLSVEALNGYA
jgi:hypothetical protein